MIISSARLAVSEIGSDLIMDLFSGNQFSTEHENYWSFSKYIEILTSNPKALTLNGTFLEVAAWADGYANGARDANSVSSDEWCNFQKWLRIKLDFPANQAWSFAMLNLFPDEGEALAQLSILFQEFSSMGGETTINSNP